MPGTSIQTSPKSVVMQRLKKKFAGSFMSRGFSMLCVGVLIQGCVMTPPEQTATIAQPKTPVAKTITNFTQAKACMDQLFVSMARRGINITSDNIVDRTNSVSVSTKDMVITTLSDMSIRSDAFRYFTLGQVGSDVAKIQAHLNPLAKKRLGNLPAVYIQGSISQADNNIVYEGGGGAISLPFANVTKSEGQSSGTISIDLQIVDVKTGYVLQGMTTSNTFTIVRTDDKTKLGGLIRSGSFGAGVSVSFDSNRREGRSQAVRTLMEYSLIELMGKYTEVPYHRCLELPSTDPQMMQAARKKFDALDAPSRTKAVQIALANLGQYNGPVDGRMSPDLQYAVSKAKTNRNLIANGRIDFQLFNALYNENVLPPSIVPVSQPDPAQAPPITARPTELEGRDHLGLKLALVDRRLGLGDKVRVQVSVDEPARLYCYYHFVNEGKYETVRILPNRYQLANRLEPGRALMVPALDAPFDLVLNSKYEEAIACVATTADYRGRKRPAIIDRVDLEPLNCGYPGVYCAVYQHQMVDTLNSSAKTVYFRAGP